MFEHRFSLNAAALFIILTALVSFFALAAGPAAQGPPGGSVPKGFAAPSFTVTTLQGKSLDSGRLLGKVVVLNFWFIACPPCLTEIPKLNQLVDDFRDREVVFIAFSPDTEEELREFLETYPFKYHIVANSTPIAERYQVRGAPTHVIIDKQGRIHSFRYGAISNPRTELREPIEALLDADY